MLQDPVELAKNIATAVSRHKQSKPEQKNIQRRKSDSFPDVSNASQFRDELVTHIKQFYQDNQHESKRILEIADKMVDSLEIEAIQTLIDDPRELAAYLNGGTPGPIVPPKILLPENSNVD